MSSEQLEKFEQLGRRAVACKMWRWMPGMLLVTKSDNKFRLVENDFDAQDRWEWKGQYSTPVPDLRDPATLGCMLALVREAWDESEIVVVKDSWESLNGWMIGTFREDYNPISHLSTICDGRFGKEHVSIYANSEAEVLLAALEAAP